MLPDVTLSTRRYIAPLASRVTSVFSTEGLGNSCRGHKAVFVVFFALALLLGSLSVHAQTAQEAAIESPEILTLDDGTPVPLITGRDDPIERAPRKTVDSVLAEELVNRDGPAATVDGDATDSEPARIDEQEAQELPASESQDNPLVSVVVQLPSEFVGANLADEAVRLFADTAAKIGTNAACSSVLVQPLSAQWFFDCERVPSGKYFLNIAGFEITDISLSDTDRNSDRYLFNVPSSALTSSRSFVVVPNSADIDNAEGYFSLPVVPLGQDWNLIATDRKRELFAKYFALPFFDASGLEETCRPTSGFSLADIVVDEEVVAMRASCDFSVLDKTGLPAEIAAQFSYSGCFHNERFATVCAYSGAPTERKIRITGDTSHLTIAADAPTDDIVFKLKDHIAFSEIPPFTGSTRFLVGDVPITFSLASALAFADDFTCANTLVSENSEPLMLAGIKLAIFDCGEVLPDRFLLGFTVGEASELLKLPSSIETEINLRSDLPDELIGFSKVFTKAIIEIGQQSVKKAPDFFAARVFGSMEECSEQALPLLETALSKTKQFMEIDPTFVDGRRPAVRFYTNSAPISLCQDLISDDLRQVTDERALITGIEIEFIRPSGPYSIVVLSPSANLVDTGWRNVINNVLKTMVVVQAETKKPTATDIYSITESRGLNIVVAAEDYVDLPEVGSERSIQGRFDVIRYDASVAKPLDDLNIVEKYVGDLPLRSVVLITDSSNEEFLPRDFGALYHWVLNRNLESFHVVSLGKCSLWESLTKNTELKITCTDLAEFEDLPGTERARQLTSVLEPIQIMGSGK